MTMSQKNTEFYNLKEAARLVVHKMPYLNSVSYNIWIPGGIVADSENKLGSTLFIPDMTMRGFKSHDARWVSEELDGVGLSHSEITSLDAFVYQGTCLSETALPALKTILDSIYLASFPEDEVDNVREMCLQDLEASEDNPSRLVVNKLIEKYHTAPFNRSLDGKKEGIIATTLSDIKELYSKYYSNGPLIVLAGDVKDDLVSYIKSYFDNKDLKDNYQRLTLNETHSFEYFHVDYNSEQTQIALASPAPNALSEDYYVARLTSELLSGGMFGRLFLEVREKRGLVYTVYNRYASNQYYGKNVLYAGTTPKNASETLTVALDTIRNLSNDLTEEELIRAKNNLKSLILIQGESSLSRSSNIAVDMWQLGEYREKDFIISKINEITINDIKNYLVKYPYENYTVVSLGKEEIKGVIK